jgi:diadenosine tetraphosphate (Ap4A) HIT family hydrolase
MDINPLSVGHFLVIPKEHAQRQHELSDESLADLMPFAKKLINAAGDVVDYNILQNNGRIAHQEVDHVHFHVIPKPSADKGLKVGWPAAPADKDAMKAFADKVRAGIAN